MQVPCVLQIFQHVPFLCAGELQATAHGMREHSRDKEKLLSLASLDSLGALGVFYKSISHSAGEEEGWSWGSGIPKIPAPALLRTCHEPSTDHSTPPSVAGDDLSIFFGNKARSFTPDIGRWAGLGASPQNQPLPWGDCSCWGCTGHIIPFSCPSGSNLTAVKWKNWEFFPLD